MAINAVLKKPFKEQADFFSQKINLPSERYDDIKLAAHDRAFIVAGAMKADLVADLRNSVNQAIAEGKSIQWFRQNFDAVVAKNGWTGWTGEGSQKGRDWRTRIIYQTNMSTSYAAGRWTQLNDPDLLKVRPYWRYVHADGVRHPRPMHLSWNGITLPHTDVFWKTHFCPNGYLCHCRITAASAADYKAAQGDGKGQRPDNWNQIDPKTGAPIGIDKGFDYAPGANVNKPMQSFVDSKLIKLDAPIGAAMWKELAPVIAKERQEMWWQKLDALDTAKRPSGSYTVLAAMAPDTLTWLAKNQKAMPVSAEIAVPDYLPFGAKQARHLAAGNALTLDEWRNVPALLNAPGAIYYDTRNDTLIFVAEEKGPAKIAIEFDPQKSKKTGLNLILTAFRVDDYSIAGEVKSGNWQIVEVSGRR
ncbi:phage minor head protein [Methylophilus sp. YYY-1]|uniref:phage head morphogenesis protein n=1 Tax=Methylophilus sp. YYY-1 TaxID=2682087 RepID=UPI0023B3361F|nr:phage minor head protein [Methylophilus sp. YYY-1]MDF0377687.1 virion morphogenesis protein [Methylophilus sp. YYY-1]